MDLDPRSYPDYGLFYELDYLQKVFPRMIWFYKEEQAKFADAIIKRYAKNYTFNHNMFNSFEPNTFCIERIADKIANSIINRSTGNTTAIGNIAYLALYGNEIYRPLFSEILESVLRILMDYYDPQDIALVVKWSGEKVDDTRLIANKETPRCTIM